MSFFIENELIPSLIPNLNKIDSEVACDRCSKVTSDRYLVEMVETKIVIFNDNGKIKETVKQIPHYRIKAYQLRENKIQEKYTEIVETSLHLKNLDVYRVQELWGIFKNIRLESATKVCGTKVVKSKWPSDQLII